MDHLINQAFDNLRMHNEILYLRAQVKRLEEEVNYDKRVQLHVDKLAAEFTQTEVERLTAEVERLRKAGDAMADALNLNDDVFDYRDKKEAQANWNAAKEGKQS